MLRVGIWLVLVVGTDTAAAERGRRCMVDRPWHGRCLQRLGDSHMREFDQYAHS